jgi:hypothetical protein
MHLEVASEGLGSNNHIYRLVALGTIHLRTAVLGKYHLHIADPRKTALHKNHCHKSAAGRIAENNRVAMADTHGKSLSMVGTSFRLEVPPAVDTQHQLFSLFECDWDTFGQWVEQCKGYADKLLHHHPAIIIPLLFFQVK